MRRRINLMVAATAVMVAVFATAAYAATIIGTDLSDRLLETAKGDLISGKRGEDALKAGRYGQDQDELRGGKGNDVLFAADGDGADYLGGGRGLDRCFGNSRDTFSSTCEVVHTKAPE